MAWTYFDLNYKASPWTATTDGISWIIVLNTLPTADATQEKLPAPSVAVLLQSWSRPILAWKSQSKKDRFNFIALSDKVNDNFWKPIGKVSTSWRKIEAKTLLHVWLLVECQYIPYNLKSSLSDQAACRHFTVAKWTEEAVKEGERPTNALTIQRAYLRGIWRKRLFSSCARCTSLTCSALSMPTVLPGVTTLTFMRSEADVHMGKEPCGFFEKHTTLLIVIAF